MEGYESKHLEKAFTLGRNSAGKNQTGVSPGFGEGGLWLGVWWGTKSELGRRSLRGVCLQLVLITGLMWCSDLKHTLTLQSQVKAGYGFGEAPSLQLLYHSFPPWSTATLRASFIGRTHIKSGHGKVLSYESEGGLFVKYSTPFMQISP